MAEVVFPRKEIFEKQGEAASLVATVGFQMQKKKKIHMGARDNK